MSSSKYVVLGGGMAAGYAAKELAKHGLNSNGLTIVSADDALPYERPPLSKSFLSGKDKEADILINPPEWYAQQKIGVKLNTMIRDVDLKNGFSARNRENLSSTNICWLPRAHAPENSTALEMIWATYFICGRCTTRKASAIARQAPSGRLWSVAASLAWRSPPSLRKRTLRPH